MLQKTSTAKPLLSSRETNTPRVFRLDVGVDTPRFPGREIACSTRVVVTTDVSTVTSTLSHSFAATSRSRGTRAAGVVTPRPPEIIDWLFIPPTGDTTGNGINAGPVHQNAGGEIVPADRRADTVSEGTIRSEILLDNSISADQTLKDVVPPRSRTSTGTEWNIASEHIHTYYMHVGTNTPTRSCVSDGTNTAIVVDMACNTAERRYEVAETNTTTHVDVQSSTGTNSEAVPLISRRAKSMPPSLGRLTRTNQTTDTGIGERRKFLTPNNIPDKKMPSTYQSARLDRQEVVPKRGDGIRDNGHVVQRMQVPVAGQHLCACCRREMVEQRSSETKDPGNNSMLNGADINDNERTSGKLHRTDEDRRPFPEFTATGNAVGVPEPRRMAYQERAVGSDDGVCSVVDCSVGDGDIRTDTRGTGDGTVRTADAETWTPTVAVADRASGTKPVHLVHKNEATDSQQMTSVGTSPTEDITSVYRGLLAAAEVRRVTVSRGTATPPAPTTADREAATERRTLVDRGTTPAVDITAAYRGALGARRAASATVTVSRGTLTAPLPTEYVDKDTTTDCTMVDRASSPIKVCFPLITHADGSRGGRVLTSVYYYYYYY